ncbi:hypothetical protein D3C85_657740 [compost metagenome]
MRAVLANLEQAHVGVPGVEVRQFGDLDAVQALDDGEQAGQHLVDREPGADLLLGDLVALVAQLLAEVADVPARQVVHAALGGEGAQLGQILLGERLAAHRQVAQEAEHLLGRLGHLGGQRQLGVVGEAQQLGQLLAQVEDLGHQRAVVVLAGVGALVGGAGGVGGVQLLAQGAVVGVGHHRVVAGELQGHQPAVEALGLRRLLHLRLGRVGQAGQCGLVADLLGPGLGGVEHLVGEGAAQLGELHLDRAVALLLGFRQVDAAQVEVAQGVLDDGLLRLIEGGCGRAVGQRVPGLVQRAVLAQLGVVGRQLGQAGLVGGAQLGAVAHGIEVADRAPGTTQTRVQLVEGQHQAVPVGCATLMLEDRGDGGAVVGEDLVDGRLDVLGADRRIGRQVEGLQQGIGCSHGIGP